MTDLYEVRADHDRDSIVMYQAYSPAIADAAPRAGRFVAPFSFHRMTWVKPSSLWLMHRSNWGRKSGQERILGVWMTRSGWDEALSRAVLTDAHPDVLSAAEVHLQWDPERSLRGAALNHYSIQVGISRHLIRTFVDDWVVGIVDLTDRARRIADLVQSGRAAQARLLPPEKPYPVPENLRRRITPGQGPRRARGATTTPSGRR